MRCETLILHLIRLPTPEKKNPKNTVFSRKWKLSSSINLKAVVRRREFCIPWKL